jgi:hypothetical protein
MYPGLAEWCEGMSARVGFRESAPVMFDLQEKVV